MRFFHDDVLAENVRLTAGLAEAGRLKAQVEHLTHKLTEARSWIRCAMDNVLYPISTQIEGGIGAEAEGLGGCSVAVLSDEPMHADDIAIQRFCEVMKQKMEQNRAKGRGGWDDKSDCTAETLSNMLRGHINKGDPVDVAIFAMMLNQRQETICSAPALASTDTALNHLHDGHEEKPMQTTAKIPEGYSVERIYDGKWKWESILAPECHSSSGFSTYEDAVIHCRMSNNMDEDDMSLEAWRQQQSPESGRVVFADINKPATDYQRFRELHLPNESLKNGEF